MTDSGEYEIRAEAGRDALWSLTHTSVKDDIVAFEDDLQQAAVLIATLGAPFEKLDEPRAFTREERHVFWRVVSNRLPEGYKIIEVDSPFHGSFKALTEVTRWDRTQERVYSFFSTLVYNMFIAWWKW